MTNESVRIERNGNVAQANAEAPTRRDVFEKAGMSLLAIIAGGFASNASAVGGVENAVVFDSPEMPNTNEQTPKEHHQESDASESDLYWYRYARDVKGLVD